MNTEFISFAFKLLTTAAMNLIFFLFFDKIYHRKYRYKTVYIAVFIFSVTAMTVVNHLNISLLNFIYAFVIINIICSILYKTTLRKLLFCNSFLILLLLFSDIATVLIWTLIENTGYNEVLENYELMCISNLLNIIIMFLLYRICLAVLLKNKSEFVRVNEVVSIAIITNFEIFVLYHLCKLPIEGLVFIIIMTSFLILNIYITYIINQVSENAKLKYELEISQRQSEMQMEHYNELDNKYEMSRKIIHDFKKHLNTIEALKNQSNEKAYDYAVEMEKEIDSLYMRFLCSNKVLSIIMSQKISAAEKNNILVTTDIQDIPFDFISALDITALFANIWDNAIEACCKLDKSKRYIELIIKKINGFIFISAKNSFDGNIVTNKENILSSKEKHIGMGLSIIRSVAEKYNGILVNEHTNSEFKIIVTLPDQT